MNFIMMLILYVEWGVINDLFIFCLFEWLLIDWWLNCDALDLYFVLLNFELYFDKFVMMEYIWVINI